MTTLKHRFEFRTIVIATDLTHSGSSALRYAKKLAEQHGSKLVVVHAIDPAGYAFPEGMPKSAAADENARDALRQIEEEIGGQGIQIHSVVESGVICERILQATLDHHADLLVLGTRASAQVGRAALGTVARRLLATAPCPILTVPPAANANLDQAGLWRNVLVATDFSETSLAALRYMQPMVGGRLTVVHAIADATSRDRKVRLERLRLLAHSSESNVSPVEHLVVEGEAGAAIAEQANRLHADLVVLGAPADELSEEDFATSTVLQVISNVNCPVLCAPSMRNVTGAGVIKELAVSK